METIPEVAAAFLRDMATVRAPALSINPLSPEEAARRSSQWQEVTPFAALLGLIALEDANNSNPYCLITRGPCTGMVFHLCHDGSSAVAFPSLAAFGASLRRAVADQVNIEDLIHAPITPLPDQAALVAEIRTAIDDKRRAGFVVTIYLPLLDPADIETLGLVTGHKNFLIREEAATFMARFPRPSHAPLARQLALDKYLQVWRPARSALHALGVSAPALTEAQKDEVDYGERGPTGLVVTMVDRQSGKVRLTMDDVSHSAPTEPRQWIDEGYFSNAEFDPATPSQEDFAALGEAIFLRLGLHRQLGGTPNKKG